jgi:hypothetical protein
MPSSVVFSRKVRRLPPGKRLFSFRKHSLAELVAHMLARLRKNERKIRKNAGFYGETGILGGNKRDQTADLLNAIGFLMVKS